MSDEEPAVLRFRKRYALIYGAVWYAALVGVAIYCLVAGSPLGRITGVVILVALILWGSRALRRHR
jgi:ABC-type uncharacterized transport system permease subunit